MVTGRKTKKPVNIEYLQALIRKGSHSVGTTRFELATPCTPCKCATGLRYVPNYSVSGVAKVKKKLFHWKIYLAYFSHSGRFITKMKVLNSRSTLRPRIY